MELAKRLNEAGQRGGIEAAIECVDKNLVAAEFGGSFHTPTVSSAETLARLLQRNDQLAYRFHRGSIARVVQEGSSEDQPSRVLSCGYGPQVVLPIVTVGEH